jgi:hypothetical protein
VIQMFKLGYRRAWSQGPHWRFLASCATPAATSARSYHKPSLLVRAAVRYRNKATVQSSPYGGYY